MRLLETQTTARPHATLAQVSRSLGGFPACERGQRQQRIIQLRILKIYYYTANMWSKSSSNKKPPQQVSTSSWY